MKKYMQVQWGENIVFQNSLQLLFSSLEALASSLAKTGRHNFKHLHKVIKQRYSYGNVELLERNRIFCYDYLDSFERLKETRCHFVNNFLVS